jgi:molecular chaperone DnaK (HSP70)
LKIELSLRNHWAIDLPALVDQQPFRMELGRDDLEKLAKTWLDRIAAICRKVQSKPHRLLLVGGGTLMPAVRDLVRNQYGLDANPAIDPLTVVARGAAVQAAVITGGETEVLLLDATPFSLGIKVWVTKDKYEFRKLIERHTNVNGR